MKAALLLERIFEEKEISVLLRIGEPLLCELEMEGVRYTCYVLQHRTVNLKNQKKALIQELLVVKTELITFDLMVNKQLTIFEYFADLPKYRIGKIGNKVFEAESIQSMEVIEDRFPKPNIYIDLTSKIMTK